MALTLATELADYASGIGTQGATLKIDADNKRVGVGTTNPQGPEGTLQVGTGITFFGNTGIISAIGGKFSGDFTVGGTLTYEDVQNVNSSGVGTFSGGINVVGGGLTVTGVSTFFSTVSIGDSIVHTGDIDTSIRFPAANTFAVETAGSERLRVDSSGNATLGDVTYGSSLGQLRIINDASSSPASLALFGHNNTTTGDPFGQIQFAEQESGTGGQIKAKIEAQAVSTNERGSDLVFFTSADSASSVATERLRIDNLGNVAIGTITPNNYNNYHTLTINGTNGGEIDFEVDSTLHADIFANGSGYNLTTRVNDLPIVFSTKDSGGTFAERVRIAGSGRVGINSTSPGNILSVDGDIGVYGSGTNHRNLYIYKDNVATAWFKYRGDNNVVVIGNNAGDRLTINPSGDLNITGITTATQLFEGTTRVATTGKAIAMAMLFG